MRAVGTLLIVIGVLGLAGSVVGLFTSGLPTLAQGLGVFGTFAAITVVGYAILRVSRRGVAAS